MRISVLVSLFLLPSLLASGQKTNWGLSHPQDGASLPHGRTETERTVKINADAAGPKADLRPEKGAKGLYTFTGEGWQLAPASVVTASDEGLFVPQTALRGWYTATVPGTVLATLVDCGVFPDPYFGLDNLAIPDTLCRRDWWYRAVFDSPADERGRMGELIFEGINYRAEVWLNGRMLGRVDGAFARGRFDLEGVLKPEGNILAVKIIPPPNPGIPHEESLASGAGPNGGVMCMDGPTFFASEGWDWMPGIRDRNMGIWQPVRLRFTDGIRIGDVQVITTLPLPDTTRASVKVLATLVNATGRTQTVKVDGRIEHTGFSKEVTLAAHSSGRVVFSGDGIAQIDNPRLWWPNGMGRQELYTLQLTASVDGKTSHSENVRFGIREFTYELTMDMPGERDVRVLYAPARALRDGKPLIDNINRRERGDKVSVPSLAGGADASLLERIPDDELSPWFVLRVNGRRVFVRGGNWGLDDAMKRSSRERIEPALRLHRDAGMNMIRNWCGQNTQESLYELCDEYGMLVFNDFWMSTEGYNLNPTDDDLLLANAGDVVARYRNHPCIAVWNARNEGYAPVYIERGLNALTASLDGTRIYLPNSRGMNLRPSGPWNFQADPRVYYTKIAGGFSTEIGTPCVPPAGTVRKMIPQEDLWPLSDTWAYHDLHNGQKEYVQAIGRLYGEPAGVDDFCRKAQLVNYDSHRAIFEAWNSRMWNDACGVLLWMTHPAWPSTVWQIYTSDGVAAGAWYGVRKACEPLHVQIDPHDGRVAALNTTLRDVAEAKVTYEVFGTDGRKLLVRETRTQLPAGKLTALFTAPLPEQRPETYMQRVTLADGRGKALSVNEYWNFPRETGFRNPAPIPAGKITCTVSAKGTGTIVEIANRGQMPVIGLHASAVDPVTGAAMPATFSDGYFTMMPGEKRVLTSDNLFPAGTEIRIEGHNLSGTITSKIK